MSPCNIALSAIRASNAAFSTTYTPTALFIGGTSGIGRAMAEVLGRVTKGNTRIVIVGRNQSAAESLFSAIPKAPGVEHAFIQCDATLLKNVRSASEEVLATYPKINFVVLTTGIMTTQGQDLTEEGVDKKLALHYYARWGFINYLLPALRKAKVEGEDAKVLSVLGAGRGAPVDLDDLGLMKTYSTAKAATAAEGYNDLMMEEYASQNPEITFAHATPGAVRTNLLSSSPSSLLRHTAPLVNALAYPLTVSAEECAERMWFGLLNAPKGRLGLVRRGMRWVLLGT
ncbi:hypothetical protein BDQ17DRAFT_1252988 [Cyathus striatus]|nr:hypothetical protein BDQ17DRAFT_1252988 [Cyathus striatus]